MIASRTTAGQASPSVTVHCKVPGGPWFVGLDGPGGQECELGPYENPAIARVDAAKLRQFLALIIPAHGDTDFRGSEFDVPTEIPFQQDGLRIRNAREDES